MESKKDLFISVILLGAFFPVVAAILLGYNVGKHAPEFKAGHVAFAVYLPVAIANAVFGWWAIYKIFWS